MVPVVKGELRGSHLPPPPHVEIHFFSIQLELNRPPNPLRLQFTLMMYDWPRLGINLYYVSKHMVTESRPTYLLSSLYPCKAVSMPSWELITSQPNNSCCRSALMGECCNEAPDKRPTFQDLCNTLDRILSSDGAERDYQNIVN